MVMDIEGEDPRTVKAGELFVVPKGVVHSSPCRERGEGFADRAEG